VCAPVRAAVLAAGYRSLATSRSGVAGPHADPHALPRVAIYRHTDAAEFARIARGQGLLLRRVPEIARGVVKQVLGNGSYDRLRRALLSHR
jgi:hypothetical protein